MNSLRRFWKIKVYVPLDDDPREASLDSIRAKADSRVRDVVEAMAAVTGVTPIGHYDHIYEMDVGFEGYRAARGASPRYGRVGQDVRLGRVAITSFIEHDASPVTLENIVEAVRAVHPWEHPIIEFTECLLYLPPD
jgi:hypothetical protein